MDLEMTGLDPAKDVIVEIATLITDDDLQILAEGPDLVVHQSDEALAVMDPFVEEMHTKSGLLDAITASTISLEDAGRQTLEFIKAHVPAPRTVPLCGNSIGMDRRFLAVYLAEIEEWLHYRSVDVSSVKELARRWHPQVIAKRPFKTAKDLDTALGSLTKEQKAELYVKLFVPINLNTATDEEILLIPGVGNRMLHEFKEYRPYESLAKFHREIAKYVNATELARLAQYVSVPVAK